MTPPGWGKTMGPCPTCEALARTVMLDQTSHDTKRQWQGLTDEELMEILSYGKIERSPTRDFDFVDVIDVKLTRSLINAIEAMLREKNA